MNIAPRIGQIASDHGNGNSPARCSTSSTATPISSVTRAYNGSGRWHMPISTSPMATIQKAFCAPITSTRPARLKATKNGIRQRRGSQA